MRAHVLVVTFALVAIAGSVQPRSARAACDCSVICETAVENCKLDVKLERQAERLFCRQELGYSVLGCQFDARATRTACAETCGVELQQCSREAKLVLRGCTAEASTEFELCELDVDRNTLEFKQFCNAQLPTLCLDGCVSRAHCTDGIQNGGETDVDCGGGTCSGCPNGASCVTDSDCSSFSCQNGTCAVVESCFDGVQNQDETDVDCGGGSCAPCPDGFKCLDDPDCQSGSCDAGICTPFACNPTPISDPSSVVNGDTSTGTSGTTGFCQIGGAREVSYVVTAANSGVLHIQLDSVADLGVYVRTVCESPFTELGCADVAATGTETLDVGVNAGDTMFVIVDGFRDGAAGPFTLQVESIAGPVGSPIPSPGPTPTL